MPRLPFPGCFRAFRQFLQSVFATISLAIVAGPSFAAPPVAQIVASTPTRGQAPFAVHVHGLNSALNAGDESTARYEWTFGDPNGTYNTLVGWNAAHIYNQSGTYTVSLKVTNQNRETHSTSLQVIVDPAARTSVYVSPNGNDSNSGSSPAAAIRTLSRAQALMGDNKAFYLERNAVFTGSSGLSTGNKNVLISAYGSGADPVIISDSTTPYMRIIQIKDTARDVVVEHLTLDSIFAPDNTIVRGMETHGVNITVRDCHFNKVSYAMTSGGGGAVGLLTQNNVCGVLGAYYIWIEGSDHTHLGNVVAGSVDEHNIRFGGASRVLIAYNDLTNAGKSSIWCMAGDHAYVCNNKLREGRMLAGPNFAVVYPLERFPWVVAEANEFFGAQVILYDGAEHIALRNNVMHADGFEAISIWGFSADRNRGVRDVVLAGNTLINNSPNYGRALSIGAGAVNIRVSNNIYDAPLLNGQNGGNVNCDDTSLGNHVFEHNIWANPKVGSRWHSLNGSILSATQWNNLPQTDSENHRTFVAGDLSAAFLPNFSANVAVPVPGVMTDFHGNPRPATGTSLAGAVLAPPSGISGDANGDGHVNVADLLEVVIGWGACGSCLPDVNHDGVVNVADLMIVIVDWG